MVRCRCTLSEPLNFQTSCLNPWHVAKPSPLPRVEVPECHELIAVSCYTRFVCSSVVGHGATCTSVKISKPQVLLFLIPTTKRVFLPSYFEAIRRIVWVHSAQQVMAWLPGQPCTWSTWHRGAGQIRPKLSDVM